MWSPSTGWRRFTTWRMACARPAAKSIRPSWISATEQAIAEIMDRFAPLDVIVNNAAITGTYLSRN